MIHSIVHATANNKKLRTSTMSIALAICISGAKFTIYFNNTFLVSVHVRFFSQSANKLLENGNSPKTPTVFFFKYHMFIMFV